MPQNNIKIFLEGGLIYGENNDQHLSTAISSIFQKPEITKQCVFPSIKTYKNKLKKKIFFSTNELCDLIANALLKQIYNSNNDNCTTSKIPKTLVNVNSPNLKHCDVSREFLPRGCVLERILMLQELDTWGAEKVHEVLQTQPHFESYKENNYGHASSVVTRAKKCSNFNCAKCFFHENHSHVDTIVQKYIMSAIAKDCSVMLTFRRLNNGVNVNIPEQNVIETDYGCYAFNIGVFDLYPKPFSCIFKHVRKRTKFTRVYETITKQ